MPTRHVTELLSAAYDGALSAAEQRRYDGHLAECPECAAAAEQFRQAIDAVHALPPASMPQRVVLPSTPPQLERRRTLLPALPLPGFLDRLPRPQLTPAWGAGVMALAGVAAVVLVVHAHVGGPSTTNAPAALSQRDSLNSIGVPASALAGGAARQAQAGIGTCPLPLAVVPQPSGLPAEPPGFGNVATATSQQRPGEQLVLSTTSRSVAPGDQVLIYAALTTAGGHASAVVPCVTLHDQGALALGPSSTTGNGGNAASGAGVAAPTGAAQPTPTTRALAAPVPAAGSAQLGVSGSLLSPAQVESFYPYSLLPSIATASPTAAALSNLPLQVLRIPANALPGTELQLVALVPSGLPGSADSLAIEAVLTLVVS